MKSEEITNRLGLEEKHFKLESMDMPVIDSHLYTTFGKRLFDFYDQNKIAPEAQREFESLSFLLTVFTLSREKRKLSEDLKNHLFLRIRRLFRIKR